MTGPGEGGRSLRETLERIEEAERLRRSGGMDLKETHVTLSHGSGGKATQRLVEGLFARLLANPLLDEMGDAAVLPLNGDGLGASPDDRLAFTTDSFVVRPLFFPGGDIGRLAVHGTVNDLAVAGAVPVYLSLGVILEEGFPLPELRRVVESMAEAAEACGVRVVAGDTKVVEKGKGDGLYVNTTGIGRVRPDARLSPSGARPGDRVLLSGPVGDHGVAVMLAREDLALESEIESDTAPLHDLVGSLLDAAGEAVHCIRDATRGGVAAALNEIAACSGVAVGLDETAIPIRPAVRGACEILGIDPLHMANEGKLVALVAREAAEGALEALRSHDLGSEAAVVGEVVEEPPGTVFVRTGLGGRRVLDTLVGDALPRIC